MKKGQETSIFKSILHTMLLVLGIEISILAIGLYASRVTQRLSENAEDILKKQVENRRGYLESMLESSTELLELSEKIDRKAQELITEGTLSLQDLEGENKGSLALLEGIGDSLLTELKEKPITGIFAVFNTEDLDSKEKGAGMPGIYLRNLDLTDTYTESNENICLQRGPQELSELLGITKGEAWEPEILFRSKAAGSFVYAAFENAFQAQDKKNPERFGHWTNLIYTLSGDPMNAAIAYSVPLILKDGTVYGVLGVEMMTEYLQKQLPFAEMGNNNSGIYMIAVAKNSLEKDTVEASEICRSGKDSSPKGYVGSRLSLERGKGDGWQLEINGKWYYASVTPLKVYREASVFSEEQWILIGAVEKKQLYAISNQVVRILIVAILLTLGAGIACSFYSSRRLAEPIARLSEEVTRARQSNSLRFDLSKTGITEMDYFSTAIMGMNREMLETSTKFLKIMEMASLDLGGYEVDYNKYFVYVTANFFELLGIPAMDKERITIRQLEDMLDKFGHSHICKPAANGGEIYRIQEGPDKFRYVRMETIREGKKKIGLIEDVTAVTKEKLRIEHERDYDALTGLYNRRAFQRESEALFAKP